MKYPLCNILLQHFLLLCQHGDVLSTHNIHTSFLNAAPRPPVWSSPTAASKATPWTPNIWIKNSALQNQFSGAKPEYAKQRQALGNVRRWSHSGPGPRVSFNGNPRKHNPPSKEPWLEATFHKRDRWTPNTLKDTKNIKSTSSWPKNNAKKPSLDGSFQAVASRPTAVVDQNGPGSSFTSFGAPNNPGIYKQPGQWVTPPPEKDINVGFTPIQMYFQVRHSNTVKHAPRSEAFADATNHEEALNAARLKEVLKTKKVQEVYSEEGYEDSGYDHADEERHAEHDAAFQKQEAGHFNKGDAKGDADNAESKHVPSAVGEKADESRQKVEQLRTEKNTVMVQYSPPDHYTGQHMYSSKLKVPTTEATGPHLFTPFPTVFDEISTKLSDLDSFQGSAVANRSSTVTPFITEKNQQPTESAPTSTTKQTNVRAVKSKKLKGTRSSDVVTTPQGVEELPTVGYIHSLTNAHYGQDDKKVFEYVPRAMATVVSNMKKNKTVNETTNFEPKKVRLTSRRKKRDEDESFYEKNEEINADEERRIGDENKEKEEYEKELSQEITKEGDKIIQDTLAVLGDYGKLSQKEIGHQENVADILFRPGGRAPVPQNTYDSTKYPYYSSPSINRHSALRYASHPREFPIKSGYGMEFYESRDKQVTCPEVSANLDDVPKSESTEELEEQPGEKTRVNNLGDQIECMKIKYFGEDPLDSPFFKETEVDPFGKQQQIARQRASLDHIVVEASNHKDSPSNDTLDDAVVSGTSVGEQDNVASSVHNDSLKFHSHYNYHPNKTLQIMVLEPRRPENAKNEVETQKERVIPVTETVLEQVSSTWTKPAKTVVGLTPPPPKQHKHIFPVFKKKRKKYLKSLTIPHDCMHIIRKISDLDETGHVVVDCRDVTLVQDTKNGVRHIKIMPRRGSKPLAPKLQVRPSVLPGALGQQTEWVPLPITSSRMSRRTDHVVHNQTTNGTKNSDHFIIDELQEDGKVRQGEVVEDEHHLNIFQDEGNSTRAKRHTSETKRSKSKLFPNKVLLDKIHNRKNPPTTSKDFDLGIRSPEEVYMELNKDTTTTATVKKNSTARDELVETKPQKMERKKLGRISGQDFLTRYKKVEKGRAANATQIWRIVVQPQRTSDVDVNSREIVSSTEPSLPSTTTQAAHPILFYVMDEETRRGQWMSSYPKDKAGKL